MRRVLGLVVAVAAAVGLGCPVAQAAPPTVEHVVVEGAGFDEFLSDACGFPVLFTEKGRATFVFFGDAGTGPVQLRTANLVTTVSANGNKVVLTQAGAELTSVTPEGVAILTISGKLGPFLATGIIKINLDTGEVILAKLHPTNDDVVRVCAMLAR